MKHNLLLTLIILLHSLCLLSAQSSSADCSNAWILCDKNPVFINNLPGAGSLSESSPGSCFEKDFLETNSVWFKWIVEEPGTLDFTILPLNEDDDLDFVLYRIKTLDNYALKETVRCMAAGPNLGDVIQAALPCTGATGLRADASAGDRSNGCPEDGENFLSSIEVKAEETYALFINNFRSAEGILIEWGGSGTFKQIPGRCFSQSNPPTSPTLNNGGEISFSDAFPNPTNTRVRITALSDQEQSGRLQIIGSDGQLALTMPFLLSIGSNTLELPTENLRTGIYFVKLRTGNETHVLRFMKH